MSEMVSMKTYIDYEASASLDSTDSFEGPEKLLEMWFAPDASALPSGASLRKSISRDEWQEILDFVKCKILSVTSSAQLDSYVLSESSLFVFDHKVILKTCGTTTLISGIEPMLKLIAANAGIDSVFRVFYSRRSFLFPDKQLHPHSSWEDEVAWLKSMFANGVAYKVGNVASDHWHLFSASPQPASSSLGITTTSPNDDYCNDQTLEILMTDLPNSRASQFVAPRIVDKRADSDSETSSLDSLTTDVDPGHESGSRMTRASGIDAIVPAKNQVIDAFGFTPCGYSCNALVDNKSYFTIHVTPEKHCSYASYESNIDYSKYGMSTNDAVEKVVEIFRPGRFFVTLFVSYGNEELSLPRVLDGYKLSHKISYDLDGYAMAFCEFISTRAK